MSGDGGCEPWVLQLPSQCGALGSGVFMAGIPTPDPAHHCCVSLTPHSEGRALANANATGLFVVEAATHPPGRFHVLVVNL